MSDDITKLLRDWLETHSETDESRQYMHLFPWNMRDILKRIEGVEERAFEFETKFNRYRELAQSDLYINAWRKHSDDLKARIEQLESMVKELEAARLRDMELTARRYALFQDRNARIEQLESVMRKALSVGEIQFRSCVFSSQVHDQILEALSSKVAETRAIEPNAADKSEKSEESSEGTRTGIAPSKIGKFVPNGYSAEGASALHKNSYADLLAAVRSAAKMLTFYSDPKNFSGVYRDENDEIIAETDSIEMDVTEHPEGATQQEFGMAALDALEVLAPFLAQPSARQPGDEPEGEAK